LNRTFEDNERLYWWEREENTAIALEGVQKTKKAPHRKSRWIYTTIHGKDFVLHLTEGQRIPRTEEAQRKKAKKLEEEKRAGAIRKRLEAIHECKTLDYPFLTQKENLTLALRSLGVKRAKIAQILSGGRRGWMVTTGAVKGILNRVYQKLKIHKVEVLSHGRFLEFSRRR